MRMLADVYLARFRHQGIQVGTFSAERHGVVRQDIIRLRKSPRSLIQMFLASRLVLLSHEI